MYDTSKPERHKFRAVLASEIKSFQTKRKKSFAKSPRGTIRQNGPDLFGSTEPGSSECSSSPTFAEVIMNLVTRQGQRKKGPLSLLGVWVQNRRLAAKVAGTSGFDGKSHLCD
ncbi:hypothetical protein BaRGS_00004295 [Batillaria attramentaria]|uniref:Uncharacterized protein n=1 Tax=Batillaria attramentaria TaxID=370345 RepID=A0ABD0LZI1_9CAEN